MSLSNVLYHSGYNIDAVMVIKMSLQVSMYLSVNDN